MAKVLVLNVLDKTAKPLYAAEVKELDDYYKHLGCDCFDIANRSIGGNRYDIFVDDIGLFKDDPVIAAIDTNGKPMLVGNLIIANHDLEGNTTSLTAEDIDVIGQNLVRIFTDNRPSGYLALMCDY